MIVVLPGGDDERDLVVDRRKGGVVLPVGDHKTGGVLGAAEGTNGAGAEAAFRRAAAADGASVPLCTAGTPLH